MRSSALVGALLTAALSAADPSPPVYVTSDLRGWTLHVRKELTAGGKAAVTERAVQLVGAQLDDVVRLVPAPAVAELRRIPIYFSPQYAGTHMRAEYHPGKQWLSANGRDPAMAKAVEFSNLEILDREVKRMPMLTLHELAHGYHDRTLGFDHPAVLKAYEAAVKAGTYATVSRRDWQGRVTTGIRAYALTNHKEYFAETTEAFFGKNDFFPFERQELERADPTGFAMLREVWGAR
ncbi:MAG: zinc-dependent peptidase [Verrucomicrobia bacterium]|nr:zinc-dependent peptidase [Verrucomicrobiota bacterium]